MQQEEPIVQYLKPNGKQLENFRFSQLPPVAEGCTRVVSISDTHNVQQFLHLPLGHILVHAGDILTESGLRHIRARTPNVPQSVKESGRKLFSNFASWFGNLPHPNKVVIAGNHDWALQGLGKEEVNQILTKHNKEGNVVYLEHEETKIGPVKIFGSPYGHWGSHNDAFMNTSDEIFGAISKDTHIVITHMPPVLPKQKGYREDKFICEQMGKSGTLLSISGHCHWAHGLYFSSKNTPCIVASVCDSHWISPSDLYKSGVPRDDAYDLQRGGYNLHFPIIVCDLNIPGGPPQKGSTFTTPKTANNFSSSEDLSRSMEEHEEITLTKPRLLFFGPSTDPDAVKRLTPKLADHFIVDHFDDASEAISSIEEMKQGYSVCIAKLGSTGKQHFHTIISRDLLKPLL
eukprot:TRINITY_DN6522_c0_g1_i2.p1 TRINITY_DN6522_c0_g1~~TRINITY_DN6522_c0_g1_i2.p1  ORF type:complete len:402 (-),score=63.12 TRINITY_DN6522_c0_g1_i2:66-1271(-)